MINNKITIKKFCEMYSKQATDNLKSKYLKDNLVITPYVPFLTKDALINNLLKTTMLDKDTGNIHTNSSAEYLLLMRILIENYTNLTVETAGFYEEYDELKKSGLFNILLIGSDATAPLIPYEEIAEFKYLLGLKKQDYMTNHYEIHSYIDKQIDRLKVLGEPFMNAISKKVAEIPKEDLDKVVEFAKKGDFTEV